MKVINIMSRDSTQLQFVPTDYPLLVSKSIYVCESLGGGIQLH